MPNKKPALPLEPITIRGREKRLSALGIPVEILFIAMFIYVVSITFLYQKDIFASFSVLLILTPLILGLHLGIKRNRLMKTVKITPDSLTFSIGSTAKFFTTIEKVTAIRTFLVTWDKRSLDDHDFHEITSKRFLSNNYFGIEIVTINNEVIITSLKDFGNEKIIEIGSSLASLWDLSKIKVEDHIDILNPKL